MPAGGALDERLADELDRAGVSLETSAAALCSDPAIAAGHMASLQCFDQVTQVLGEIAGVLRRRVAGEDPLTAIRLDALRARMGQAHG